MTLDTEGPIETGRSWLDLPASPPQADAIDEVPSARPPHAVAVHPVEPDTIPLPADRIAPSPPAAAPHRRPWTWLIAAVTGVALLAALLVWSPWTSDESEDAAAAGGVATGDEPIADVAARLLPSVVQIEHDGVFGAVGSGFVYEEGRVLTAAHVVAGAREVTVRTSDGQTLTGTVLGGDPVADIAVVAIDADVPPAELATGETPQVGQLAVAIGSPLGFEQSVTSGIVSAVDRRLVVGGTELDGLIQTDAPINQGNSGGPLADRDGRVIGVNVAIATASGGSDGLGFAVGIDKAVEIADRYTSANPEPESLEGGSPLAPGLLPPELEDLLDDFLGGGGGQLPSPDELNRLLDDLLRGQGDLEGLLDGLLGPDADLNQLLDDLNSLNDGGGELPPGLLDYLLQLLLGSSGELTPDDLNNLFEFFQGEGG